MADIKTLKQFRELAYPCLDNTGLTFRQQARAVRALYRQYDLHSDATASTRNIAAALRAEDLKISDTNIVAVASKLLQAGLIEEKDNGRRYWVDSELTQARAASDDTTYVDGMDDLDDLDDDDDFAPEVAPDVEPDAVDAEPDAEPEAEDEIPLLFRHVFSQCPELAAEFPEYNLKPVDPVDPVAPAEPIAPVEPPAPPAPPAPPPPEKSAAAQHAERHMAALRSQRREQLAASVAGVSNTAISRDMDVNHKIREAIDLGMQGELGDVTLQLISSNQSVIDVYAAFKAVQFVLAHYEHGRTINISVLKETLSDDAFDLAIGLTCAIGVSYYVAVNNQDGIYRWHDGAAMRRNLATFASGVLPSSPDKIGASISAVSKTCMAIGTPLYAAYENVVAFRAKLKG